MPPSFLSWHLNPNLEKQISRGKKKTEKHPKPIYSDFPADTANIGAHFFVTCPSELTRFWTACLTVTSVHCLLATPMQRQKVQFSGSPTLISLFLCKPHALNCEDEEQEERRTLPYGCSSSPLLFALSRERRKASRAILTPAWKHYSFNSIAGLHMAWCRKKVHQSKTLTVLQVLPGVSIQIRILQCR